jgi:hypothetical protein
MTTLYHRTLEGPESVGLNATRMRKRFASCNAATRGRLNDGSTRCRRLRQRAEPGAHQPASDVEDVKDRILIPVGPLFLAQFVNEPRQLLDNKLARISCVQPILSQGTQTVNRVFGSPTRLAR